MTDSYGIIYAAENKVDCKTYVGATCLPLIKRISQHLKDAENGSRYPLHRAIRIYGKQSFEWRILAECKDAQDLSDRERHFIRELDAWGNGYNIQRGGYSEKRRIAQKLSGRTPKIKTPVFSITIAVPPDLYNFIDAEAESQCTSRSSIIRLILKQHFEGRNANDKASNNPD